MKMAWRFASLHTVVGFWFFSSQRLVFIAFNPANTVEMFLSSLTECVVDQLIRSFCTVALLCRLIAIEGRSRR